MLPISDKVAGYAQAVLGKLLAAGLRATLDQRPEKINPRIRDAQLQKIPVMLVVGAKEAENESVAYRDRTAGDWGPCLWLRRSPGSIRKSSRVPCPRFRRLRQWQRRKRPRNNTPTELAGLARQPAMRIPFRIFWC